MRYLIQNEVCYTWHIKTVCNHSDILVTGQNCAIGLNLIVNTTPVSYTHLDVYKRQIQGSTDEKVVNFHAA